MLHSATFYELCCAEAAFSNMGHAPTVFGMKIICTTDIGEDDVICTYNVPGSYGARTE